MQAEAASAQSAQVENRVVTALRNAAAATGSDFHYLLGTAMRESSLKPNAQSGSSSATGLFQFVDQTWLGLVKDHGAQYGLGNLAAAITKQADGHYHAEPAARQAILALRKDPEICSLMAGEFAKTSQGSLRASLGREICGGELYAAHFLGADSAAKLIKLAGSNPSASAAAQFPQAAASNRSVFYHGDGKAKSVREVYDWALQQPGAEGTARVAQAPAVTQQAAMTKVVAAHDAQIQMLLASVMNWQPRGHGMFANLFGMNDQATPSSAMSFAPGLLGLLSDAKDSAT